MGAVQITDPLLFFVCWLFQAHMINLYWAQGFWNNTLHIVALVQDDSMGTKTLKTQKNP